MAEMAIQVPQEIRENITYTVNRVTGQNRECANIKSMC
jgi:hypothetical protein